MYSSTNQNDKQFEQRLLRYLRSTGRMAPETPEEVEALLRLMPELEERAGTEEEALAVLRKGNTRYEFRSPQPDVSEADPEFRRAAARNSGSITDEVQRQMDKDRNNAMNNPDNQ